MAKQSASKPRADKAGAKKATTKSAPAGAKRSAKRAPVAPKKATSKAGVTQKSAKTAGTKRVTSDPASVTKGPAAGGAKRGGTSGIPGLELDVRIAEVEPEIWRRIRVPANTELCDLHLILQLAFDWENSHRHQFSIGIRSFGPEGTPDAEDYDGVRLSDLVGPGSKLVYEYDFGDGWEHVIRVLEAIEIPNDAARFQCVDGARRGPVEDSGGPSGYMMLLDDLADPSSEQHKAAVDLAGEAFDAQRFDRTQTNGALAELDRRLRAVQAGPLGLDGATSEQPSDEGDLVLLFEAGEGNEIQVIELPDVIVRADAKMLDKLASFFSIAARAVREHGRATPDIYLSDFLRDDDGRADIIVTQS